MDNISLEKIRAHYKAKLPFVIYRKPNSSNIQAILQNDDYLHVSKAFKETGFIFSPFDDAMDSVLLPLEHSKQFTVDFTQNVEKGNNEPLSTNPDLIGKAYHTTLVEKGITAIETSVLKKVVLSRKETLPLEGRDALQIFEKLVTHYKGAFAYCWYHPKIGLWLGATPETLLKIEGNQFSIMALAGTQSYAGSLDVEWQDKELQEQQFVTDFILKNIETQVSAIKVSKLETVKAGNLLHLRTLIKGHLNLNTLNFEHLVKSLHPTPAVCGLPKQDAKTFILENENYNRAFYTGFLGELNFNVVTKPRTGQRNVENRAYAVKRKSTQLYVNLRCMQLEHATINIYIGGGITETSNPEREWEETVAKSLVVKKVL